MFFFMGIGGCSGDDANCASPPTKVDLTAYDKNPVSHGVEFSADSKVVCVGWCFTKPSGAGRPLHAFLDADGNRVEGLCDATGKFTLEGAKAFPKMVASTKNTVHVKLLKGCSPFAAWPEDAGGWGFSDDCSLGLRIVNPRSDFDGRKLTIPTGECAVWTAELWQLTPAKKRLWSMDLPRVIGDLELVEFSTREKKNLILLSFGEGHVYILSQADGRLIETVDHRGRVEQVPESRPKNWRPRVDPLPAGSSGHVYTVAFSPSRNLLCFGQSPGKDVSVVSLERPPRVVYSGDAFADLPSPSGGSWTVDRVEFVAGGNLLIVGAHFAGGGTSRAYYPTAILDTRTWKRVWWENSSIISHVTVSPDGKRLALVRATRWSKTLEIGPFIGKTGE